MSLHRDHINIDLFARLSQGEEAAFRQLVYFYYQKMLPVTVSLVKSRPEAQDILQEVFLKLWLNRAILSGIENPAAWLNTVLANTTANYIRARLRYELKMSNLADHIADQEEIVGDLDALSAQRSIDEAVGRLPDRRKQIFLLSRREGLSRKEIARQLNISENTVRNQLVEAINFIRDYLRREGIATFPIIIIFLQMTATLLAK